MQEKLDRFSIVGSFVRPKKLLQAKIAFANGKISHENLQEIEDEAIKDLIKRQRDLGIKYISDGEFRKSQWYEDFLSPIKGFCVKKQKIQIKKRLTFSSSHPFVRDFLRFKALLGDDFIKTNIPNFGTILGKYHMQIKNKTKNAYENKHEKFRSDLKEIYKTIINDFYNAGARYLQLDDTFFALLSSRIEFDATDIAKKPKEVFRSYLEDLSDIFSNKPKDLLLSLHVCRGNTQVPQIGDYAFIKELFGDKFETKVNPIDVYFLEWDEERFHGSFKALKSVKNSFVYLGLISTRKQKSKNEIKENLKKASEFINPRKLGLAPQCGFSPNMHYYFKDYEAMWDRLKLGSEIINELENEGFFT